MNNFFSQISFVVGAHEIISIKEKKKTVFLSSLVRTVHLGILGGEVFEIVD